MRVALDTNILAYAEGVGDRPRRDATVRLLHQLAGVDILIPAQVLGELYRVLTGKALRASDLAREAVLSWADAYLVADSTWSAFQSALDLGVAHRFQFWDALILSVAVENKCRLLLSEDLQQGFTWRGICIVNPYAPQIHPLLKRIAPHGGGDA